MPHFRNFHGTTFLTDENTVDASLKIDDLFIDAETITADKYVEDLVMMDGTGNDTINADKGDDQIHFSDELTILVEDGQDQLYLKNDTGNDTINAHEPVDQLYDPRNFGETPPLDVAYELQMDAVGETDTIELDYMLEVVL